MNTGIAGLDGMIAEGFWRGSTTLVAGPTGSGKTIIGLQFHRARRTQGRAGSVCGSAGESQPTFTHYAELWLETRRSYSKAASS